MTWYWLEMVQTTWKQSAHHPNILQFFEVTYPCFLNPPPPTHTISQYKQFLKLSKHLSNFNFVFSQKRAHTKTNILPNRKFKPSWLRVWDLNKMYKQPNPNYVWCGPKFQLHVRSKETPHSLETTMLFTHICHLFAPKAFRHLQVCSGYRLTRFA